MINNEGLCLLLDEVEIADEVLASVPSEDERPFLSAPGALEVFSTVPPPVGVRGVLGITEMFHLDSSTVETLFTGHCYSPCASSCFSLPSRAVSAKSSIVISVHGGTSVEPS